MVSIYVDDFLLTSKNQKSVNWIKKRLNSKYNVNDLDKMKTIIKWQVICNLEVKTLKIDKLAFI